MVDAPTVMPKDGDDVGEGIGCSLGEAVVTPHSRSRLPKKEEHTSSGIPEGTTSR